MNTNTPISENAADALYDAATAQYAGARQGRAVHEARDTAPRQQLTG